MQLRLLPLVIFAAALMLTFKIGSIVGDFFPTLSWNSLKAQTANPQSILPKNPPQPENKPMEEKKADTKKPLVPSVQPNQTQTLPAAGSPVPAQAIRPRDQIITPADLPQFTQSEIDLLQKLSVRRDEIEARGRELDVREGLVKASEARLDKKIAELKAIQAEIEKHLRTYNEQEEAKMRSLVKIYESMKPKDAGKIFEELDMPILLGVIERMKEQKAAAILAEVNPQKAKAITAELTQRRQLPNLGQNSGG